MEPEPQRADDLDKLDVGKPFQTSLSGVQVLDPAQERGRHAPAEVGVPEQAEHPEEPGRDRVKIGIAQSEAGSHVTLADPQLVQPAAFVRQTAGKLRHRPLWAGTKASTRNAEGKRETAAVAGHLRGGFRFSENPTVAHAGGQ